MEGPKYIPPGPRRRRRDKKGPRPARKAIKFKSKQEEKDFYSVPYYDNDFYQYQTATWNEYMLDLPRPYYTSIRSSFIPYTIINHEKYWLLGSFQDFPREVLADFGGKCIIKSKGRKYTDLQKPFGCAMLEVHEESKGLLDRAIMKSLANYQPEIYLGVNHEYKAKVWFIQLYIEPVEAQYVVNNFRQASKVVSENFGPMDLYLYQDVLMAKDGIVTTHNLTDFLNYIKAKAIRL